MNVRIRTLLTALVVVGVAACFALPAFTEDEQEPAAPQGDPMAEAWKAAGTPGPDHAWMGFMVGSWDVDAKFWMGPGEPQTSTGRMETHWHLGRRYLRMYYAGDMEGESFQGEATMGFNNMTKQYETAWIDSMSTAIARGEGKREGDVITITGDAVAPGMGPVTFRTVYTKKSDDEYVMEDHWNMPGMGEMKIMELTYTRVK